MKFNLIAGLALLTLIACKKEERAIGLMAEDLIGEWDITDKKWIDDPQGFSFYFTSFCMEGIAFSRLDSYRVICDFESEFHPEFDEDFFSETHQWELKEDQIFFTTFDQTFQLKIEDFEKDSFLLREVFPDGQILSKLKRVN